MNNIRDRGGMQVHAVPESERAYDSSGRQLPWGFEYADSEHNQRRIPEERGPFGKSTRRRGLSRSKTATPARKEDSTQLENARVIDEIFNSFKEDKKQEDTHQRRQSVAAGVLPGSNAAADNTVAAPTSQTPVVQEPTEVILYGFGSDFQWAAIEFYERVSNGIIYEDYDRHPPHSKYNLSLSLSRATAQRTLSQAALRKKNQWVGGEHWIKVTFDSPQAAELACHYSPHNIQGYVVYAERYRGTGPKEDVAFPVSRDAGASSATISPTSSHTLQAQQLQTGHFAVPSTSTVSIPSSTTTTATASSATATATAVVNTPRASHAPEPFAPSIPGQLDLDLPDHFGSAHAGAATAVSPRSQLRNRPPRIPGAKRAELLPAEMALLPVTPRWQQTFASIPLLGMLFGSGGEVIGNEVPRREDGSFDWDRASWYWRLWALLERWTGMDLLGGKEE